MNNNFIKLLNDKGDIEVYKYTEIPDSDPLHEPTNYYEKYVYNVFDLLKENEKLKKKTIIFGFDYTSDVYEELEQLKNNRDKLLSMLCQIDSNIMKKEYAKANQIIHKAKNILKGDSK